MSEVTSKRISSEKMFGMSNGPSAVRRDMGLMG